MRESLDEKFQKLLNRLPQNHAIPELAYGTLPTAMAIRSLELQREREQRRTGIGGAGGIPSAEAFGGDGRVLTQDLVEALENNTLELSSVITIPSNDEVVGIVGRVEDLLRQKALTQIDLLALSPRQFEEFIAELFARFGYEVELTPKQGTRDGTS